MRESQQTADLNTAELFRKHAPFVARFLSRLGVRADELDDVVQEVFLVVHRTGGYTAGPAKPTTYLASIAVNAAFSQRRKQQSGVSRAAFHDPDDLASDATDPVRALETQDALGRLQLALDRLDDTLRATLLLADGEGETCPSIAAAMGVPVGTVYWRLDRARKKFRQALIANDAAAAPRATLETMSLFRTGRVAEAEAKASAFSALYPQSGFARAIRRGHERAETTQ